jgi:hypothetical protein
MDRRITLLFTASLGLGGCASVDKSCRRPSRLFTICLAVGVAVGQSWCVGRTMV